MGRSQGEGRWGKERWGWGGEEEGGRRKAKERREVWGADLNRS
jgi:hypothetical protein